MSESQTRERRNSAFTEELFRLSQSLSRQVELLRDEVHSVDRALEQEDIPELNINTSNFLGLQSASTDKK